MSKMSNRLTRGLALGAAASAAVLAMSATSAHAATTYTPSGGPGVNFVGSSVSFTDVEAGQTLTCTKFDLGGSVVNPGTSRAYGATGGSMSTLSSSGCTNPIAGSTTVTPTGTWGFTATGDPTGTVWPARLTSVSASVVAAGCSFNVGGVLNGTFNTSNQKFTPGATGLTITSTPSGAVCALLGVEQGDTISVAGSWTNTPPSGSGALSLANP